jgi:hypothetical protein
MVYANRTKLIHKDEHEEKEHDYQHDYMKKQLCIEDQDFLDEFDDSGSLLVHYEILTKGIVLQPIGIIHGSRSTQEKDINYYARIVLQVKIPKNSDWSFHF